MGVFQYADYLAQALYSPGKPIKFPNVIQNLEQADQQLRLLGTAASLLLTTHDSLHRRLGSAPVNADAISEELEHMHSLIFKGKWDKDGKHYVRTFSSDEERDTVNRAFHVLADAYGFKHERLRRYVSSDANHKGQRGKIGCLSPRRRWPRSSAGIKLSRQSLEHAYTVDAT